ncbi:DEKNAAC103333 [Brettanomyces naardenensis]|uniref:DEKNAAC103333 n=1 Tax=Brettanomyces naardenensis TaxID=13370 RepID=A0A448YNK1_BRENA|nr:DEKNAAC103333 [Brettanomyces naardenensis]
MDPLEEQKQEIEIIQSIYPDELVLISDKEYTINLQLEVGSQRHHAVKLHIRYPAEYPEVVPEVWVVQGDVDDDQDDEQYEEEVENDQETAELRDSQRAIDLIEKIELDKDDLRELSDKLSEEAKLNIGMPSVFSLASVLKDDAERLFGDKLEAETKKLEEVRAAREREEQKKFNGTKVTKESFEEWRVKFRKEMGYDERLKKRYEKIHLGKLTGKEIFERGLAGEEGADEGGGEGEVDEVEEVTDQVAKTSI